MSTDVKRVTRPRAVRTRRKKRGWRAYIDDRRRKRNFRPRISTTEKVIGIVIVLLLAGIAFAIYEKGKVYDPALFALDESLLSAEAAAVAATVPAAEVVEEGASAEPSFLIATIFPSGWHAMAPVETFTPETLYVKINGRAEAYLGYGFQRLETRTLISGTDANTFIDVFVYDMGNDINALGIFSAERSEGEPASIGEEGYFVGASLFFRKGRYYTQILASEETPDVRAAVQAIGEAIAAAQTGSTSRPWADEILPTEDRVADSFTYYAKDVYGLEFLSDVYAARYSLGGAEFDGFLTRRETEDEAASLLEAYGRYLNDYGTAAEIGEIEGARVLGGEIFGVYDIVFQKGRYFGGVTGAPDLASAEEIARRIADAL